LCLQSKLSLVEGAYNKLLYHYKQHYDKLHELFFEYIVLDIDLVQKHLTKIFINIKQMYHRIINLLQLHFNYMPNGKGFIDSKNDFWRKIQHNIIKI
jgi:hypothetical protein